MIGRADLRHLRIRFDKPVGGSGVAMVDLIAATLSPRRSRSASWWASPCPAPRIAWRRMFRFQNFIA
jgi:hypothetical protein